MDETDQTVRKGNVYESEPLEIIQKLIVPIASSRSTRNKILKVIVPH